MVLRYVGFVKEGCLGREALNHMVIKVKARVGEEELKGMKCLRF